MRRKSVILFSLLMIYWLLSINTNVFAQEGKRPNIIIILVDDMGYSDIGCYGSEIRTPNIDKMAKDGIKLINMHNNAVCTQSRASLLTGKWYHGGASGSPTLPKALNNIGYTTAMFGKGHISSDPISYGFQSFFGFTNGESNYFTGDVGETVNYYRSGTTPFLAFDNNYYSTDAFTDSAISFVKKQPAHNPFFLYLSYQAPHSPLQVPATDIAKYRGTYLRGWKAVREARYQNQLKFGIVKSTTQLAPFPSNLPDWDKLTPAQRDLEDLRMSVYAAMIERIDIRIGKLLQSLQASGELNNTCILFMSDNGANANSQPGLEKGFLDKGILPGDKNSQWFTANGWGYTSVAPFRLYKTNNHAGGVRTGGIVYWPTVINPKEIASSTSNPNGVINATQLHFTDVMPTLLDIAYPTVPATKIIERDNIKKGLVGKSFLQSLFTELTTQRTDTLYTQLYNDRSVRTKDWVMIESDRASTSLVSEWELYSSTDVTELNDVAASNPDVVLKLNAAWMSWYKKYTGNSTYTPGTSTDPNETTPIYVPSAMRSNLAPIKYGFAFAKGSDHLSANDAIVFNGTNNRPPATIIRDNIFQYSGQDAGTKGYPIGLVFNSNVSHRLVLKKQIPAMMQLDVYSIATNDVFVFEYPNVPESLVVYTGNAASNNPEVDLQPMVKATSLTDLKLANTTTWVWENGTAYVKYKQPSGPTFSANKPMASIFLCLYGNCASGLSVPIVVANFDKLDIRGSLTKVSGTINASTSPSVSSLNGGYNYYDIINNGDNINGCVEYKLDLDVQNWESIDTLAINIKDATNSSVFIDDVNDGRTFLGQCKSSDIGYQFFNLADLAISKKDQVKSIIIQTCESNLQGALEKRISLFDIVLGTPTSTSILPVNLLSFSGFKIQEGIQLKWVTVNELNNSHFDLYRSATGTNFVKIATSLGGNNASQLVNYSYNDLKPLDGNNYYRLHQIDNDGTTTLSSIVVVNNNILQNPTTIYFSESSIKYKINLTTASKASLQVFDITGRKLINKTLNLQVGTNNGIVPANTIAKGVYILVLKMNEKIVTQRIFNQ